MKRALLAILVVALLSTCRSAVFMYNPRTGQLVECLPHGLERSSCIDKYSLMGYKPVDELTPEEREKLQATSVQPGVSERRRKPERASGTCFAVGPDGVLLTAYHVIEDAKSVRVRLAGGTVIDAKVQRVSPQNDLAILQINVQTPYFLPLAPPGSVRAGDRVFTMGYPVADVMGQEPKFTEGSVSALSGIGGEAALLQISVPIQPGNSGGPLVNERGEVVGVVTSTAAVRTFFAVTGTLPQNVNWAVKADYARLMFNAPSVKSLAVSREQAIQWTRGAICLVEATSR